MVLDRNPKSSEFFCLKRKKFYLKELKNQLGVCGFLLCLGVAWKMLAETGVQFCFGLGFNALLFLLLCCLDSAYLTDLNVESKWLERQFTACKL